MDEVTYIQFKEYYEKKIQDLEKRILALESIINGTNRNKPRRIPLLSAVSKAEVIRKHDAGNSYSSLAAEYAVSKTTIYNICNAEKRKTQFIIPEQKD